MNKQKAKADLTVRVRFSNPLPDPPCPPKLLDIPTDPMRYAEPKFLDGPVSMAHVPMVVDGDYGMPIDLGLFESLWEEDADDSDLNPDPLKAPKPHPKDAFLMGDLTGSSTPFPNGSQSTAGPSTPLAAVTWLRKTEYISRENTHRASAQELKHLETAQIDVSQAAQLRMIEASFTESNELFDLSKVRHPSKPELTPVESYEVLPDAEIWANQYDLFRFSERPGDHPPDVDDPRLDCAILRPMKTEHDSFLAYYLTQDDGAALAFKEMRAGLAPYEVDIDQLITTFKFIRDYETVKVDQDVHNEFLLVLHDGNDEIDFDHRRPVRKKGAYYKNIERKMQLKKKRINDLEKYEDKWEIIHMTHVEMDKEEEDEREEALAEVVDPNFLFNRGEADADGELDDDGAVAAHV